MTDRETLAVIVEGDLLREITALAKARGLSKHEIARVCLGLGLEAMAAARSVGGEQLSLVRRGSP